MLPSPPHTPCRSRGQAVQGPPLVAARLLEWHARVPSGARREGPTTPGPELYKTGAQVHPGCSLRGSNAARAFQWGQGQEELLKPPRGPLGICHIHEGSRPLSQCLASTRPFPPPPNRRRPCSTERGGGQSWGGRGGSVCSLHSAWHPGAGCWDQVSTPWSGESLGRGADGVRGMLGAALGEGAGRRNGESGSWTATHGVGPWVLLRLGRPERSGQ